MCGIRKTRVCPRKVIQVATSSPIFYHSPNKLKLLSQFFSCSAQSLCYTRKIFHLRWWAKGEGPFKVGTKIIPWLAKRVGEKRVGWKSPQTYLDKFARRTRRRRKRNSTAPFCSQEGKRYGRNKTAEENREKGAFSPMYRLIHHS